MQLFPTCGNLQQSKKAAISHMHINKLKAQGSEKDT